MNELQNFNFEGNEVRTIQRDSITWFAANDVTKNLGLSNTTVAVSRLDDDEVTKFNLGGLSGKTNFINEPGLYKLIGASRKPEAKKFNRWVTHEVLPTIRKHGMYATDDLINNPDLLIQVATQLKEERTGRLIAEQQVQELRPKATYYDLILRNKSLLSISKISKDFGMSPQKLNSLLHEYGIQYKQGGIWLLYSKYQDRGYTQSKTFVDDTETSRMSTYWTQAGRIFIYDLLKEHEILPMIERQELEEAK